MIGHRQFDHATHIRHLEQAERHVAQGDNRPGLVARVDASGLGNDPEVLKIFSERARQRANTLGDNTVSNRRSTYDEPSRPLPSGKLEEVLQPGYFADAVESSVRPFDRIEVTAGVNGEPEFAMLVVRSVVNPRGGGKSVEVERLG
jgi:hypothetical protein